MTLATTTSLRREPPISTAFTQAPLQIAGSFEFDAPPSVVFDKVSHDEGIRAVLPMVRTVRHEGPDSNGACSVGAVRICDFGPAMGKVRETIVWWDAPRGYAFQAEATRLPIRDHLAYFLLELTARGGTRLTIEHYFRRRRLPHALLVREMMASMITKAMAKLAQDVGGRSGRMTVCDRRSKSKVSRPTEDTPVHAGVRHDQP
ncbi:MAG: SRPBCC family protein [Planctomycetota bacterium]